MTRMECGEVCELLHAYSDHELPPRSTGRWLCTSFPLLGARVEYVLDRPAAALVYGRRKHRINLFTLPSRQVSGPTSFEDVRNGYNILVWPQGDFVHYAVSDLNRDELRQFAELPRATFPTARP
jgi:anti-sigma factor RsiW